MQDCPKCGGPMENDEASSLLICSNNHAWTHEQIANGAKFPWGVRLEDGRVVRVGGAKLDG